MTSQRGGDGCCPTLEELADHAQAGPRPHEAHVRACPDCRARLGALHRLDALSAELFQEDIRAAGAGDRAWLEDILANLGPESGVVPSSENAACMGNRTRPKPPSAWK